MAPGRSLIGPGRRAHVAACGTMCDVPDDPGPDADEGRVPRTRARGIEVAGTAPLRDVLARAVGGPLGVAESTLPAAAFVAVATATRDTVAAAVTAVSLAAVLAGTRIVRGQTPKFALAGVAGVAIAGYVASRTGRVEDFFLPGLLINIGYAAAWAISIAVRWPLLGVIVAGLTGGGGRWREDPVRLRAYSRASWIWVALFLSRVAVQLPLYLAGALVALGAARIAMGVPLFAVGIWLCWLLLRDVDAPQARAA
jgi:hypothetical protein